MSPTDDIKRNVSHSCRDFTEEGGRFIYPESLLIVSQHLSFMIGEEIRSPAAFLTSFPTAVTQVVDFFEAVHVMHERASELLRVHEETGRPYCLYLRAFSIGGYLGNMLPQDRGLTRSLFLSDLDAGVYRYLSECLDGVMPVISCFNTLNMWGLRETLQSGAVAPAALRLLSHNWTSVVGSLIDGAHCIVLARGADYGEPAKGVEYELRAIYALGQKDRTIFLVSSDAAQGRLDGFDVYAAFGCHEFAHRSLSMLPGFGDCVTALATDENYRKRRYRPGRTPRCYVVDKGYDSSDFESGQVSEAEYAVTFPDALRPNVELFLRHVPPLLEQWGGIETRLHQKDQFNPNEVENAISDALKGFVLATTLESYEAMATCLGIIGVAHYIISRSNEIGRLCALQAGRLARYTGDRELVDRLAQIETYMTY